MDKKAKSTILLVDDDKRVLKSLKMWLGREGFTVLDASNCEEAVKTLAQNPVDVALVDFRISKEDGISVSQKLRDIDEDIKIIIFTGFPSYETAVHSMKIGAFDYLSKSSPSEQIIRTLRNAVEERTKQRDIKNKDTSTDKRIKLVLFCNHSLIKERLETYLKNSRDLKLVKTYPLADSLRNSKPVQDVQVALVCAACIMENFSDSYTFFPVLFHAYPDVKVLMINENFGDHEKMDLLRLGIRGFCPEDSGCDTLQSAINHIAKGELWVSRKVAQMSLDEMIGQEKNSTLNHHQFKFYDHLASIRVEKEAFGLTLKEIEILKRISLGAKNKEVAADLSISEATVKTHINRILKKMGVDNRTKAILAAMERKIL
jgi:DNA-binding NarL/FixJ family response regulator